MRSKLVILVILISYTNIKGQENRTTFGLQYKPIIPSEYFNSAHFNTSLANYNFNLSPKYSSSFGMLVRHKINRTFSIESGLNYTQRNYKLRIQNNNFLFDDKTTFGIRSYEIPLQLLTYVRTTKYWYLNVAFGGAHNILASDILSYGVKSSNFYQNMYRKSGGYRALLANIGMEYRTEQKGCYYIGSSLHFTWSELGRSYPNYNENNNSFNNNQFEEKFFIEIKGNFITIDFRYFFP